MSTDSGNSISKPDLRAHFRALREVLSPEEVSASSLAACRQVAGWSVLHQARTVLTYLAFRNELDLSSLVRTLPRIRWAVPRIVDQHLIAHEYDPQRLVAHHFGMLEPDPSLPVVGPDTIDVVLVPGVAFDTKGGRLGFGGGFYDRFLVTTPAVRVGATYDSCLVDALPCQEHDQRVDWVLTPSRLLRCAGPPPG